MFEMKGFGDQGSGGDALDEIFWTKGVGKNVEGWGRGGNRGEWGVNM